MPLDRRTRLGPRQRLVQGIAEGELVFGDRKPGAKEKGPAQPPVHLRAIARHSRRSDGPKSGWIPKDADVVSGGGCSVPRRVCGLWLQHSGYCGLLPQRGGSRFALPESNGLARMPATQLLGLATGDAAELRLSLRQDSICWQQQFWKDSPHLKERRRKGVGRLICRDPHFCY